MANEKTARSKKTAKKKAPLRKAKNFMKEAPGIALRLMLYVVVTVVMGLLFSVIQSIGNDLLRILLAAVMAFAVLGVYFMEGVSRGTADAASSRQLQALEKLGQTVTAKEDAACYHPLKAAAGAFMLFALPLALAIVLALNAEDYTYALQDLPTWMTGGYASREDVMAPLGAYTQAMQTGVIDWIRIVVRLFMLVFINLFKNVQTAVGLIDRLSPLFILLYPLAFVAGYMFGPMQNAKMEKMNKRAKKIAVRKQQKKSLTQELLGGQNVPHYGHQADKNAHKKKELI